MCLLTLHLFIRNACSSFSFVFSVCVCVIVNDPLWIVMVLGSS